MQLLFEELPDLPDVERTCCVCSASVTLPGASTTESYSFPAPCSHQLMRSPQNHKSPPQVWERGTEVQPGHLLGNLLRDLSKDKGT